MVLKIFCDKCGAEIPVDSERYTIHTKFGLGATIDERHLCGAHLEEYLDHLEAYFREEEGS